MILNDKKKIKFLKLLNSDVSIRHLFLSLSDPLVVRHIWCLQFHFGFRRLVYNRRGQLFTTLSDLLWVSSSPVSTSLGRKSAIQPILLLISLLCLVKNASFLTAHFNWTLNIGFNCQPVRLPLYNHGGGKGKGCFFYDWKEKACKLHRSLGVCLRACIFSTA